MMNLYINNDFLFKIESKNKQAKIPKEDQMTSIIEQANKIQNQISMTLIDFKDVNRQQFVSQHRRYSAYKQEREQQQNEQFIMENTKKKIQVTQDLICPICKQPFYKPVQLTCQHCFCYRCIYLQSQIQNISQCPICNEIIQKQKLNKIIKQNKQALLHDLVITLVDDGENVPVSSIGFTTQIDNGYVTEDSQTIIIDDNCKADKNLIATKICTVQTANGVWLGKQSDLEIIHLNQLKLSCRIKQNSIIVDKKFLIVNKEVQQQLQKEQKEKEQKKQIQQNQKENEQETSNQEVSVQEEYTEIKEQKGQNLYQSYENKWINQNKQYYTLQNLDNVQIILYYDDYLKKYIVLDKNIEQKELSLQQLQNQYICLDFNWINDNIQLCAGCGLKLRNPIKLQCGCYYCYTCAQKMIKLKINCLKCGQEIQQNIPYLIEIQNLNKDQPCSLDIGFPCEFLQQQCILESDPTEINCLLLTQQGEHIYQATHQVVQKSLQNYIKTIRPRSGLGILNDNQFIFVYQTKQRVFNYMGINQELSQLTDQQLWLNCHYYINDFRKDIIKAKQIGKKMQDEKIKKKIQELKQQIIKEKRQQQNKIEKQRQQQKKQVVNEIQLLQNQRRKQLGLLSAQQAQKLQQKVINFNQKQQQKTNVIQKQVITNKINQDLLIELSTQYPDINLVCPACYQLIKNPLILKCNHIVCKTCSCILQANGDGCPICQQQICSQLETKQCTHTLIQLSQLQPQYFNNNLDIGQIVTDKQTGYMGVIIFIKSLKQIGVSFADSTKILNYEQLVLLDVDEVVSDTINIGSPVMIINHQMDGIQGIVTIQNENLQDDEFNVICQTTLVQTFKKDNLKKLKMKQSQYTFEYWKQQLNIQNQLKDKQLRKEAEKQVESMSVQELQEQINKNSNKIIWM